MSTIVEMFEARRVWCWLAMLVVLLGACGDGSRDAHSGHTVWAPNPSPGLSGPDPSPSVSPTVQPTVQPTPQPAVPSPAPVAPTLMDSGAPDSMMAMDAGEPAVDASMVDTGSLPAVDDLGVPGPYTPERTKTTGPGSQYELFKPMEIVDAVDMKFPILAFGPGALSNCELYHSLLEHVASHGFVVACFNATASGANLIIAIDWMFDEATSGPLAGKLDTDNVAVAGQSAGSLGAFDAAVDPRITTTVHLQGGTFPPHTAVNNLHAPAAFLCGESPPAGGDGNFVYDQANAFCEVDFENAMVPVFYGSLKGGAHAQVVDHANVPMNDPVYVAKVKANYVAMVGWLRWRLTGDMSQRDLFVGSDCGLCAADSGWVVKQKDLETLD